MYLTEFVTARKKTLKRGRQHKESLGSVPQVRPGGDK